VPGFIGFAVGRTTFWDPLISYRDNKITRPEAVAKIAASYREWVDLFEKASLAGGYLNPASFGGSATWGDGTQSQKTRP
jgi:hypothetical protein